MKRFRLTEWFRESLLAIPALFVAGAVGLSALALAVGEQLGTPSFASVLFRGDGSTAQSILSTIAASTITLTGLVFSVTMLVLQLTSSRYSPRVLRTFLRDRTSKVTLGIFVGTFTYCLAVLRTIDTGADAQPGLATSVAVLLALTTVAAFVQYINHIARRIRASSIIESIAVETDAAIDVHFPESTEERGPWGEESPGAVVRSTEKGVLLAVDVAKLVQCARREECRVDVLVRTGDFVPRGGRLLEVRPAEAAERIGNDIERHLTLGADRTMEADPAYGFRQLVDIAELSLSPAVNDPTTAVQSLDAMHDLLRKLADRPFPTGRHRDEDGHVRVRLREMTWEDYLDLAIDEIVVYGRGSVQVTQKLHSMLEDLLDATASPERRAAVRRKMAEVIQTEDVPLAVGTGSDPAGVR